MENDKDKESFDEKIWNTFVNIVCLLVCIAYKLVKGYFGLIKRLAMNGIFRVIAVIFLNQIALLRDAFPTFASLSKAVPHRGSLFSFYFLVFI